MVSRHDLAQDLRVGPLAERRRADEVAEHDGDRLPDVCRGLRDQDSAAGATEPLNRPDSPGRRMRSSPRKRPPGRGENQAQDTRRLSPRRERARPPRRGSASCLASQASAKAASSSCVRTCTRSFGLLVIHDSMPNRSARNVLALREQPRADESGSRVPSSGQREPDEVDADKGRFPSSRSIRMDCVSSVDRRRRVAPRLAASLEPTRRAIAPRSACARARGRVRGSPR